MRGGDVILFVIVLTCSGFSYNSTIWEKVGHGIYESEIRTMAIDQKDNNKIYVGTSKALYSSTDKGMNYRSILRPSGNRSGVNDVFISPEQPESIYAATDSGLYETQDDGKTWKRIYYSSDERSRQCHSVIRHESIIYLGTQKGLFQKKSNEVSWNKKNGKFNDKPVYHLAQDDRFLYGVTGQTIYSLDKQTHKVQKMYSIGIGESHNGINTEGYDLTTGSDRAIKFIDISSSQNNKLAIATSRGIFVSNDHGKNWKGLPINNLAVEGLTSIVILDQYKNNGTDCLKAPLRCAQFLAGTDKGVLFLSNERWIPIYKGMETNQVSYLTKNERGSVYAATTRGIYFLSDEKTLPLNYKQMEGVEINPRGQFGFDDEPSINEVHQLAIDYAEVSSQKIANWRVLARRKALLPDLSVGLDRDAADLFHWNTGANPDELQKGRDFIDWDVSLSWDLADVVWSTDQTTIDSRSKLMVELREDILDEVTRLYFERRRIQVELLKGQLNIDKEMRIAELTALIDALTGGEFSRRILRGNGKEAVSHQSSVFSRKGY